MMCAWLLWYNMQHDIILKSSMEILLLLKILLFSKLCFPCGFITTEGIICRVSAAIWMRCFPEEHTKGNHKTVHSWGIQLSIPGLLYLTDSLSPSYLWFLRVIRTELLISSDFVHKLKNLKNLDPPSKKVCPLDNIDFSKQRI